MNRYYFHLWTGRDYEVDEIGIPLESAEAACVEAFHGAREIFMEMLREGRNATGYRFDIYDQQGLCLHEVSFAEALGQRVSKKSAQADCLQLVDRGYKLAAELKDQIARAKLNLRSSRQLLSVGAELNKGGPEAHWNTTER